VPPCKHETVAALVTALMGFKGRDWEELAVGWVEVYARVGRLAATAAGYTPSDPEERGASSPGSTTMCSALPMGGIVSPGPDRLTDQTAVRDPAQQM
jgi:hypothetical protein